VSSRVIGELVIIDGRGKSHGVGVDGAFGEKKDPLTFGGP
jgi:hypothetical protein